MEGGFGQFDAIYNIIILVVIITLIGRRTNFPSTIALIFAGLVAASIPTLPLPELSPDVFLAVLLPPILFNETLTTDIEGLIDDSDTIIGYAVLGTALMVIAVVAYTFLILKLTLIESFLMGIIIAPTDPVAVIATFKRLGVVKRFQLIVAGESLFNDGVAIVVYSILLMVIESGSITAGEVAQVSLIKVIGGLLLGYTAGYIIHLIFCWTFDLYAKILLTFVLAFGVFRLAEGFHASGVIAVVIAGLILNYRCKISGGLSKEETETLEIIWEFTGFLASSFAFIFIGVNLETNLLYGYVLPIFGISLFSVLFRYLMVDIVAEFLEHNRSKRIPRNWRIGMTWSGLRGAVSVVLVLGISGIKLPNIDTLLALTYGVVLGTNVFQGLSMPWVVKQLNLYSTKSVPEIHTESE
jgi:CPA1 family monovalent cation:H+ antiporter